MLISPPELLEHISQNAPMILFDCPFDLSHPSAGANAYAHRHLPEAFYVDLDKDLCAPKGPGNHPFQDAKSLIAFLEDHGVNEKSLLILYDRTDLAGPARFYCQLKELGLKHVRVLDGGLPAFEQIGGPLTKEIPDRPAQKGSLQNLQPLSFRVDIEEVRASMKDPKTLLIDSRARNRYLGLEEPLYPVAGHIPTALSYPYQEVQDNGRMKPLSFLRSHFAGLETFEQIILSCGSGVSACVNSLALDLLEISHVLYNGSYSEWISDPKNLIETRNRTLFQTTLVEGE